MIQLLLVAAASSFYDCQALVKRKFYEVWQKSNATGNAVHEPTMLLPPPSHGS
jgi:hypothetical protein